MSPAGPPPAWRTARCRRAEPRAPGRAARRRRRPRVTAQSSAPPRREVPNTAAGAATHRRRDRPGNSAAPLRDPAGTGSGGTCRAGAPRTAPQPRDPPPLVHSKALRRRSVPSRPARPRRPGRLPPLRSAPRRPHRSAPLLRRSAAAAGLGSAPARSGAAGAAAGRGGARRGQGAGRHLPALPAGIDVPLMQLARGRLPELRAARCGPAQSIPGCPRRRRAPRQGTARAAARRDSGNRGSFFSESKQKKKKENQNKTNPSVQKCSETEAAGFAICERALPKKKQTNVSRPDRAANPPGWERGAPRSASTHRRSSRTCVEAAHEEPLPAHRC